MVWGRLERIGLASVAMVLLGAACTSKPDEDQPLTDSYHWDNAALLSLLALLAFGVAAWAAASRLRSNLVAGPAGEPVRWARAAAPAAIVLALSTPLVLWAASNAMFALAFSDPSFDAWGLVLQVVPAVLVSAAAVRCARAARLQTTGRALALSATILAYLVWVLMIAATLVSCAAMLGQGG
ncbi:hypothetical protein ACQPYH_14875 [Kribbella sp. CA-245084]|uniref:hypothetical protein n=1 Tax=Kribbella sp. CA-245084 TaxID=3239940 RepID=UPI003D8A73EA